MALTSTDLVNASSPDEAIAVLRHAAQAYYESSGELANSWQDPQAGKIWSFLAKELERVADKTEKEWAKV